MHNAVEDKSIVYYISNYLIIMELVGSRKIEEIFYAPVKYI